MVLQSKAVVAVDQDDRARAKLTRPDLGFFRHMQVCFEITTAVESKGARTFLSKHHLAPFGDHGVLTITLLGHDLAHGTTLTKTNLSHTGQSRLNHRLHHFS